MPSKILLVKVVQKAKTPRIFPHRPQIGSLTRPDQREEVLSGVHYAIRITFLCKMLPSFRNDGDDSW